MTRSMCEIKHKLGLDSVGTLDVLDRRMSELDFEEIRLLMVQYHCTLEEIVDKVWAVECLGKTRTSKIRK